MMLALYVSGLAAIVQSDCVCMCSCPAPDIGSGSLHGILDDVAGGPVRRFRCGPLARPAAAAAAAAAATPRQHLQLLSASVIYDCALRAVLMHIRFMTV